MRKLQKKKSISRKKNLYAIWSSDVKAEDKYKVTTLPTKFFPTREKAHAYAKKRGWTDYKVMRW